jgi:prevent-host-death family protein
VIEVSLPEAGERLEQLIEEATAGEDVIITSRDGAAVRLVALKTQRVEPAGSGRTVGHGLDWLIDTWSQEEEKEFLQAIEVFEQVDESFWK